MLNFFVSLTHKMDLAEMGYEEVGVAVLGGLASTMELIIFLSFFFLSTSVSFFFSLSSFLLSFLPHLSATNHVGGLLLREENA